MSQDVVTKFKDEADYPEVSLTEKIIKSAFEVFNELGYGLPEKVYQRALAEVLQEKGLSFSREKYGLIKFRNVRIGKYSLDFLVENKVAVELKVRNDIYETDVKQLLTYIKSENLQVGLILAFTKDGVKIKRLINSDLRGSA